MRAVVRAVALRRLVLEPGRTALLVLGIALGVAVLVAVRALNATALRSVDRLEGVQAGTAALEVSGGASGLEEALVAKVRATPGVRAATPIVARVVREARPEKLGAPREESSRRVLVLGLDLADDRSREAYALASGALEAKALAFAPIANAAAATRSFAERRGLAPGGVFHLYTARGKRPFLLAGTFEPTGLAAATLGGDVVVLPLRSAQAWFGPEGRVDRIAVALEPGARRDEVASRLRERAGPGADVHEPGEERAVKSKALIGTMQLGLELASLLALIIGTFLIYNAMSIAVVRRRPEIGVLRAVGAKRRDVALLFFAEACAYGVVGAALGILLGIAIARVALEPFSGQVSQLYFQLDARAVVLAPRDVAIALLLGPLATVVATVPPVLQALSVSPVEAARKDLPRRDPLGAVNALAALGGLVLALALALYLATPSGVGLALGTALQGAIVLGAALVAPRGVVLVVRRARPLLARALGPTGLLAGDNLLARPGRTGVTVAALMVALGGVLSIAGLVSSLERGVMGWLDRVLVADVYLSASTKVGSQANTLLDASLAKEVQAAVPGLVAVFPLRFVFEECAGAQAMIVAIDMAFFSYRARFPEVAGDLKDTLARAGTGEVVAVSSNFARRRGLWIGDACPIRTPSGVWSPRIGLVVTDFTSDQGCLFVDRSVYRARFGDDRANAFDVFLRDGATEDETERAAAAIRERFGDSHDLFVTSQRPFRESIVGVLRSAFQVTYAMQVVAIGVALLGVVTTLFATILERTREVGVLRAIGASRGHVRRAVVTEAFLIGAIASGFALTTGVAQGKALVERVLAGVYGWELPYVVPVGPMLFGALAATALATLAGALPAARAARIRIVEALAYE